jgi:hypothetical protein
MAEFLRKIWEDSWETEFRYYEGIRTLAESYLRYLSDAREWVLETVSRYIYRIVSNFDT